MDFGETLEKVGSLVFGKAAVEREEFEHIISPKDRQNLDLITNEIKKASQGQPLGAEVLVVGGSLNHPQKPEHKDIDVKISMKSGHSARPAVEAIDKAIQSLTDQGFFQMEKAVERSNIVDENIVTTYYLHPDGGGTTIEIIPPYGQEDLPAELEKTVNRGRNRRYYFLKEL